MTTAGALQNQQLVTEGKDFSLQRRPSPEAGWHGEEQGDKKSKHGSGRVHIAASQIQPLQ